MGKEHREALHELGIRVTPQRAHVWRVLVDSGEHLTAEDVWQRAEASLPGLELSTVYRTLDTLREAGLVSDSRLPEGARLFEARRSAHPHLVCEACGGISHPAPPAWRRLLEVLNAASEGFEVKDLHVTARGVCAGCAARRQGRSE